MCRFVKMALQKGIYVTKNIVLRVNRNLARRLREARREVGLSTRAVSEKLPRRAAVSHATLASYEKGVSLPSIDVLAALANIYQRPLNWFLENRETLSGFRYRNLGSRVPLSDQRQFEAVAGKWAEAYFHLEKHLRVHQIRQPNLFSPEDDLPPAELAVKVRENLNLDDDQPIQNVVQVLERFSAWAMELKASFGIDSAAARHGDEFVVLLNPDVANDCARMNAAHELAHLLYDDCKQAFGWSDEDVEKRAYAFAAPLLMPHSQLEEAFAGKSFLKLIQYKEKFGISLAAMIYLAEREGVINTTTSRWLSVEMTKRGWRHNEPGYVWRDRAIGFEMMLEYGIQNKFLTWGDAERVTGIREADLRQRLLDVVQTETTQSPTERDEPTLKFPT